MTAAVLAAGPHADSRVATAVGFSLLLHVGGMALMLYRTEHQPQMVQQEIDNIDILERAEEKRQAPLKPKSVRQKEMAKNFLKMALPTRPRGLQKIEMKTPETRKIAMDVPKLKMNDRRLTTRPDMKLDLSKNRPDLAKIDQKLNLRERHAPVVAPKLAEVGIRRAKPKVLEMAQLAERQERNLQRGLGDIKLDLGSRRNIGEGPKIVAKTRSGGSSNRLLAMLPEKQEALKLQPRSAPRRRFEKFEAPEPAPLKTRQKTTAISAPASVEKKAVEIEGPLSARKVAKHSVPAFPARLEEYGVYEAEVAIKFYVSPVGTVLGDRMSVERSSSYGWLDRLVMEHLKKWRFDPLPMGGRNEWGVITFRFFLE